ncbi:hypothetical protein A3Q56_01594 [Intoshia linei]|uniref:Ubiquitin-like domain-containing protein n=1 Tax=Intoshia linei TaxID=1819745 RepID=A0A177B8Q3_9BILA|nr:hypothetical protein A3Q56_01594 [Intoshia linei]
MVNLTVRTLNGQIRQFCINEDIQISRFKQMIENQINIPSDQQRLLYQCTTIADDESISNYDGKTLYVVSRQPPARTVNRNENEDIHVSVNGNSNVIYRSMPITNQPNAPRIEQVISNSLRPGMTASRIHLESANDRNVHAYVVMSSPLSMSSPVPTSSETTPATNTTGQTQTQRQPTNNSQPTRVPPPTAITSAIPQNVMFPFVQRIDRHADMNRFLSNNTLEQALAALEHQSAVQATGINLTQHIRHYNLLLQRLERFVRILRSFSTLSITIRSFYNLITVFDALNEAMPLAVEIMERSNIRTPPTTVENGPQRSAHRERFERSGNGINQGMRSSNPRIFRNLPQTFRGGFRPTNRNMIQYPQVSIAHMDQPIYNTTINISSDLVNNQTSQTPTTNPQNDNNSSNQALSGIISSILDRVISSRTETTRNVNNNNENNNINQNDNVNSQVSSSFTSNRQPGDTEREIGSNLQSTTTPTVSRSQNTLLRVLRDNKSEDESSSNQTNGDSRTDGERIESLTARLNSFQPGPGEEQIFGILNMFLNETQEYATKLLSDAFSALGIATNSSNGETFKSFIDIIISKVTARDLIAIQTDSSAIPNGFIMSLRNFVLSIDVQDSGPFILNGVVSPDNIRLYVESILFGASYYSYYDKQKIATKDNIDLMHSLLNCDVSNISNLVNFLCCNSIDDSRKCKEQFLELANEFIAQHFAIIVYSLVSLDDDILNNVIIHILEQLFNFSDDVRSFVCGFLITWVKKISSVYRETISSKFIYTHKTKKETPNESSNIEIKPINVKNDVIENKIILDTIQNESLEKFPIPNLELGQNNIINIIKKDKSMYENSSNGNIKRDNSDDLPSVYIDGNMSKKRKFN